MQGQPHGREGIHHIGYLIQTLSRAHNLTMRRNVLILRGPQWPSASMGALDTSMTQHIVFIIYTTDAPSPSLPARHGTLRISSTFEGTQQGYGR